MAARTLDKMRKAQSLLRECHSWLVENNETRLAVDLCQIEGSLALFFENRCFANSPCPGLQGEELPRLPPSNGYRNGVYRRPYNGGRRPRPTNRDRAEASARRASGEQNVQDQGTASTPKDIASKPTCPDANLKPPEARATITRASPPTGLLLDFDNDVELVQLSPNMVADMGTGDADDLRSKGKQRLPEWPATTGSAEPAPEGLVQLDGDKGSLHQTIGTVPNAPTAGLDSPLGDYCSLAVEEGVLPVPSQLPGTDANNYIIKREERDVHADGLGPRAGHILQPEDLEDDEIVFQGNTAKGTRPDFKASFVRRRLKTSRRALDPKFDVTLC
ncbi:uncharacterized protein PGRI_039260 [Penicillium griseofulvum]|uniref:Uncharacterized protein n=1 Tax=Penicillium patulum TaxID=5078 RepID=A0A135LE55_PENPA|nr:uncharacterized protein PGRI_039260 [Penicillium griseofulvum]KXG47180.1 hypothetical protein PGRI_039260 [Penicillium griseofulvum]